MTPRTLRALLAATLLAGLAVPVAAATADPSYDWFVTTLTAGPDGASSLFLHGISLGELTGEAAYVFGSGFSVDDRVVDLHAWNFGLGPERISTSRDAGGITIDIAPGKRGPSFVAGFESFTSIGHLDPGQTFSQLFFDTGAASGAPAWTLDVGSGAATMDVSYGAGSTVIVAGDPNDGGVSANLDATGVGTIQATRTPAAGIVGAAVSHCNGCRASWAAPDGRSGGLLMAGPQWLRVRQVGVVTRTPEADVGGLSFAGPAGTWRFGWEGLDRVAKENNPAEIAYAPIGDAWHRFRSDPLLPSNACAGGTVLTDETVGGALRVAVVTASASPGETDVCVRVEDAASRVGVGGELVLRSTGSGPPALPVLGSDPAACTAPSNPPNQVTGPHPYMDVLIAGRRTTLDVYRDDTRAMLCFGAEGLAAVQVVVPLPAGASTVEFRRDPVPLAVDGLKTIT